MKKLFQILLLTISLVCVGCVSSRRVNYMQKPDRTIPHYEDTIAFTDYEVRVGDRLYIYVYSLDENINKMYNAYGNRSYMRNSGRYAADNTYGGTYDLYTYLVDEEGNITFPTLGKIQVLGMTTREVKLEMEKQLSALLKDLPGFKTISVEANIVQRMYYIIGIQSGRYNIVKEKMTIFEAIAQAGDIQQFADRSRIKLVREKNGETVIKEFDIRSQDIVNSEFYYIEPNDIIYIRYFNGYSFGVTHFSSILGLIASTLSVGMFVYSMVQLGISLSN